VRRWLVERFFAWIQWQRRILVRWEYHAQNFLGFGVLQKDAKKGGQQQMVS
jgi:transposase